MKFFFYIPVFALFFSCTHEHIPNRPNVILIMCDDLGWGDTGFNGNEIIKTPNLDLLASKGMVFNRFYSASPVCSPTRASCLTGRNPYRMDIPGANSGHMKIEEVTLAEILRKHKYKTGHFGKWHLGTFTSRIKDANRGRPGVSEHFSIPTQHGFNEFFSTESKVPTYDPMKKPKIYNEKIGESPRYGWAHIENEEDAEPFGTYYWNGNEMLVERNLEGDDSKLIMDKAIDFIRNSNKSEDPFFCVIWLHTPHLPVVADKIHRDLYKDHDFKKQLYFGTITAMDEQVGRLWETLIELGESRNTMIWFSSDNGPENGTPGSSGPYRERKRSLYEGGVRVPAFCVWENKIAPHQSSSVPIVTSDYLPTILDMISVQHNLVRPMDGISLKGVITGIQKERGKSIGFLFGKKMSWVSDRFKLISIDNGNTFELYDLIQ
ncbi:MAG: sulfatase-like hydrolase/transferase, partial [Cyclobacteriaceae bacterium]|nr:sulfatase-like hydrolase/transferase [Cyclobacteriaceae bacterium]